MNSRCCDVSKDGWQNAALPPGCILGQMQSCSEASLSTSAPCPPGFSRPWHWCRELNSNSSVHSQGIRHQQKQFHGKPACSQLCPQHTLHAMGPQDLQLALHGQLKPPTIMVHAPESCTRCFRNTARKRHAGGSGWAARSASVYRGRRSVLKG